MFWVLILLSTGYKNSGNVTEFSKPFYTKEACETFGKNVEEAGSVGYVCVGYSR